MSNQPKSHHYVPAFYLSMFTMGGTEGDKLCVLDKNQRRIWQSTPRKTARENDYYKVEELRQDPMAIERALSQLEGKCAPVVRDVVQNERLPTGEDFQILLNFVALSVVRVPNVRSQFGQVVDQLTTQAVLPNFLGSDGASLLRYLAAIDGHNLSDSELQELQAFVESGEFHVDLDRTWHIQTMVEFFDRMLPALAQRNWAVWTSADHGGDFVCSDQPVALWDLSWPPMIPPHFAQPNTILTFPLSRRVMLLSRFEEMPSEYYVMDRTDVAMMNTHRAMYANQIYSAQEHWTWTSGSDILDSEAFLNRLRDR